MPDVGRQGAQHAEDQRGRDRNDGDVARVSPSHGADEAMIRRSRGDGRPWTDAIESGRCASACTPTGAPPSPRRPSAADAEPDRRVATVGIVVACPCGEVYELRPEDAGRLLE